MYRNSLPQLGGDLFITDGGLETTLIFADGLELPQFAAFDLLKSDNGRSVLRKYFETYTELASKFDLGLVLETATWRSNPDWGTKLGYDANALSEANIAAVQLVADIRDQSTSQKPIVISGCVGPRGDGYVPDAIMTDLQAEEYHHDQIETFSKTEADLVTAVTMNYCDEAIGITRAAKSANMPVVVSFTVETDGQLITGRTLEDAIKCVDDATDGYVSYFMINCAHPTHFDHAITNNAPWTSRIRGLRANASRLSHSELDEATELDAGNPEQLGNEYAQLITNQLTDLRIVGGCCGTDHRHVEQIAKSCLPIFQ